MLDVVRLLSEKFVEQLAEGYHQAFANSEQQYCDLICGLAEHVIHAIAQSNTLYHNVEHTIQVTLVGQCILQGKMLNGEEVSSETWLNFIAALLCHDVGYVRGICQTDTECDDNNHNEVQHLSNKAVGIKNNHIQTSDAVLMPLHIDRGKQFVEETLGKEKGIDVEFVQQCIERTRFPVPDSHEYQKTSDFPGLVRGADLVGQLSDPRYLQKVPAVFFEFEESGYNSITGYKQPGDLIRKYGDFYRGSVEPYVLETLKYLSLSEPGRDVVKSLQLNLQLAEEGRRH